MSKRGQTGGFTLIELMVAVAIIGVLATVALPNYKNYVIRANRADAQQTLMRAAQGMERYAVTNGVNGYTSASLSTLAVTTTVTQSPATGTAIYNMAFVGTPGATTFTIQATPAGTRVNKSDGYLQINQAGTKVWQGHTDWNH